MYDVPTLNLWIISQAIAGSNFGTTSLVVPLIKVVLQNKADVTQYGEANAKTILKSNPK